MSIQSTFLLVIALNSDSFLAFLAYGGKHIRMPWKSAVLISLIGVPFLSFFLHTMAFMQQFISLYICRMISSTTFFAIGLNSLFQGTIKLFLGTYKRKKLNSEYSGVSFALDIYLDETKADADNSRLLSLRKALYLAVALSIGSLADGFALGIDIAQPLSMLVISLRVGTLAILGRSSLDGRILPLEECRLSRVNGVPFLILAFLRVL